MLIKKPQASRSFTTTLVMASLLSLTLGLSACSTSEQTAWPDENNAVEQSENRDASWAFNKMRVCVQNKLSEPLQLEWSQNMLGDDGEYLPAGELSKQLGPEAFTCAVSWADMARETVDFKIRGYLKFKFTNSSAYGFWPLDQKPDEVTPDVLQSYTIPAENLKLQWKLTEKLKTVGEVEAYPLNVYLTNP